MTQRTGARRAKTACPMQLRAARVVLLLVVSVGLLGERAHATFPWEDWGWQETHPPTPKPTPSPTPRPTPAPTPGPTPPPGCSSSAECGDKRVCVFGQGVCAPLGTCVDRPLVCPADFDPVCGCDGRTYSNSCKALDAGQSVRFLGPCRRMAQAEQPIAPPPPGEGAKCGTAASSSCINADHYCEFEHGACGEDGQQGRCAARPSVCTMEYMPFCGCDGKTYGNRCSARGAGVSIRHQGECGQSPPAAVKQLRGEGGWKKEDMPRSYHVHRAGDEADEP